MPEPRVRFPIGISDFRMVREGWASRQRRLACRAWRRRWRRACLLSVQARDLRSVACLIPSRA